MKHHEVIDQLRPDPLDPEQIVAGSPEVDELTLLEADDGSISGLWRLSPGTVTDTEVEESFLVISGRGTVNFQDGRVIDLAPGVTHRFEGGEATTWIIEETLLKAYWIA